MKNREFWSNARVPRQFPAAAVLQRQESVEWAIRPNGMVIRPIHSTDRPIDVIVRPDDPIRIFLKSNPTVGHSPDWDGRSADPVCRSTDRRSLIRSIRRNRSTDPSCPFGRSISSFARITSLIRQPTLRIFLRSPIPNRPNDKIIRPIDPIIRPIGEVVRPIDHANRPIEITCQILYRATSFDRVGYHSTDRAAYPADSSRRSTE